MADRTPSSTSSYHNETREMKLESKNENDLKNSSHPKQEVKEEHSISNEPCKSNILDLIKSSRSDASHKYSQEFGDGCTEIKTSSTPFDGKTQAASRKKRFYELVTASSFHGITSSTLDFIYKILEDQNLSKSSELSDKIRQAFSALEDELFNEDEEVLFEKFSKLPLEVRTMIWEQVLLEPKVVRIGIVPTERTIRNWQYYGGELLQTDSHKPMLLERNHILKTPPCSLLSVNRESRNQALQVHGVFWEQKRPCEEAEDGYVSINLIYVNWEIDTVWLDYNLSIAWRDAKLDPSDRQIIPLPAYEMIRRLAIPAESIEWPSDMQQSDTGSAIADFPGLKNLTLLVPTKETVWSDPIIVPTAPNTTFSSYICKFHWDALGAGLKSFLEDDEYDLRIENYDLGGLRDWVNSVFPHTLARSYSLDREIAAGHIRDLSTRKWPWVRYMEVSTIEKEKVKVRVKALLDVLPVEVYEIDNEETVGRRRGLDFARRTTFTRNLL